MYSVVKLHLSNPDHRNFAAPIWFHESAKPRLNPQQAMEP